MQGIPLNSECSRLQYLFSVLVWMCFCIFTTVIHTNKKGKPKYLLKKSQKDKRRTRNFDFILRSRQFKLEKTATRLLDQRVLRTLWKNEQTFEKFENHLTHPAFKLQQYPKQKYLHISGVVGGGMCAIHNQPSHIVTPQGITVWEVYSALQYCCIKSKKPDYF